MGVKSKNRVIYFERRASPADLINVFIQRLLGVEPKPRKMKIGKNVFIGNNARLDNELGGRLIEIGDEATITDGALILTHEASTYRRTGMTLIAPVRIGARAFIGANSIIMPGVSIGEDAVVAAGAVVTDNVRPGVIVAGVPAREIGFTNNLDNKIINAGAIYINEDEYRTATRNEAKSEDLSSLIWKNDKLLVHR